MQQALHEFKRRLKVCNKYVNSALNATNCYAALRYVIPNLSSLSFSVAIHFACALSYPWTSKFNANWREQTHKYRQVLSSSSSSGCSWLRAGSAVRFCKYQVKPQKCTFSRFGRVANTEVKNVESGKLKYAPQSQQKAKRNAHAEVFKFKYSLTRRKVCFDFCFAHLFCAAFPYYSSVSLDAP